ncbi:MAG: dTMP kinase [Candidatus Saganbacteria bacterium]|nr:dTMP kinase [Candidatus Saganbacteria bacterium]
MFITLEGGEGCGKSTQAKALAEHLLSLGKKVVLTREPGGTSRGEMLRQILLAKGEPMATYTELFLFSAARAEHVEQVILPALKSGAWVISDRYVDSTTAYQIGGRGLPEDVVHFINMVSSLLDCPVEEGLKRIRATRTEWTKFEDEKIDFHNKVRSKFLEIAKGEPHRIKIIDSSLPIREVEFQIRRIVGVM